MKILKFGGSSVGTPDRIKNVAKIIIDAQAESKEIAVVVSAFQGVTDILIDLSARAAKGDESFRASFVEVSERHIQAVKELIPITSQSAVLANVKVGLNDLEDILQGVFLVGEYSARMLDYIMSFGERFSAYIICEHMKSLGVAAAFMDARQFIKTDENWGAAKVNFKESYKNIAEYFASHKALHIITGFIASTPKNDTITLGRGGSDYTAALFAAGLKASEIEIWTDVDGVMTADPRKVSKAFFIPALTYEEIMELSHFGAKVVYPPTIQPALDSNIPVAIRNTFNPKFPGTRITSTAGEHKYLITGISSIESTALLRVEGSGMVGVVGVSMRLFGALAKKDISVILITQASSEHTICLAVPPAHAEEAKALIEQEFTLEISANLINPVNIERDLSIVSIVGENMRRTPGISAKLFGALGHNGINVVAIAQGSSELNISVVVHQYNERKALNALHDEFFASATKTINLFIVGTGLIATELLRQIDEHADKLKEDLSIDLRVVAISNRSKTLIGSKEIDISNFQELLEKSQDSKIIDSFVKEMLELNLPNSIFVDCTASEEVVVHYDEILTSNVAIVTPNKKAQTRSMESYRRMKDIAKRRSVGLLYETSVGAGLPVISTLNDLIKSGDSIVRIEAVLSGTLSFIFNTFDGSQPFSAVVKQAREKGYTEPDPRDDLCGADVARKLLILARESGLTMELKDIAVENLVPESCRETKNIDEFFSKLQAEDGTYAKKSSAARNEGKKLCYIGVIENGKAAVSLQAIDSAHPFSSLSGTDNIISFTTQRYNQRPLVVKGPGAGASVTAAGVFADVIRLAQY